ncbi:MAG: hypothetical protein IIX90_03520 [Clostridia bacterium]|nr:hypothetical protein [Clostridia bacterium]
MKSKARTLYEKYPDLFSAMFEHSFREDPEHPDDISVIYSKLMANAMGKAEPYWTPAEVDMAPIYDELRKAAEEAK